MMTESRYIALRLLELNARRKAAHGFSLNTDMHVEKQLLDAQIAALQAELEKKQKRCDNGH